MKKNTSATCATCPWAYDGGETNQPQCRKNPPVVMNVTMDDGEGNLVSVPTSLFPAIEPTSWCGSHPDCFTEEFQEETFMGMGSVDTMKGGGA